jgi:hypothetical protein
MPIYNLRGTLYDEPFTFDAESMRIERERDIWEGAYTRDLRLDAMVPLHPCSRRAAAEAGAIGRDGVLPWRGRAAASRRRRRLGQRA